MVNRRIAKKIEYDIFLNHTKTIGRCKPDF